MRTAFRTVAAIGTAVALAACGGNRTQEAVTGEPTEMRYAPELGVDLGRMNRLQSGLYVEDLEEGSGAPARNGLQAVVHYTGWLADGSEFDSSRGGEPLSFTLGAGEVIEGWDAGVAGMHVGGRRRLVIPPDLAYGASGAGGVIPPNATLIFEVELVEVR